jgi:hypothetical protein
MEAVKGICVTAGHPENNSHWLVHTAWGGRGAREGTGGSQVIASASKSSNIL